MSATSRTAPSPNRVLVQAGNELHFGTSNSISRGSLIFKLARIDGLSYLKVHSSKRTSPTSLTIKRSATTPTTTGLVAVQRRADRGYWKIGGGIATRIHVKPRKELFNPTVATTNPMTGKESDSYFHELSGERRQTRSSRRRQRSNSGATCRLLDRRDEVRHHQRYFHKTTT